MKSKMLERAKEIIRDIATETDSIILMHSLSGKDSIALLDLCAPHFKRIVCVYMYFVPGLEHIGAYYRYASTKYRNTEWLQVPHYAVYSHIKNGFMGCEINPKQRLWKLADIIDKVRERTGIEWCCLGFKQTDSLNRLLMLRSYKDGKESICWKGKKFYPLSTYKNNDVLAYIEREHLKSPESYGGNLRSAGHDPSSFQYLYFLQKNFPSDLEKIYTKYPRTRFIIPQYEQEQERNQSKNEMQRNRGDKTQPDNP